MANALVYSDPTFIQIVMIQYVCKCDYTHNLAFLMVSYKTVL